MDKRELNPNIRVTEKTRKDLKVIAALTGETMLEVVKRLASMERERLQQATHNAEIVPPSNKNHC